MCPGGNSGERLSDAVDGDRPRLARSAISRMWAQNRRARIWAVLHFSGAEFGRGADAGSPDSILRMASGPRTTVAQPNSAPGKLNIVQIRAFRAEFRLNNLRAGHGGSPGSREPSPGNTQARPTSEGTVAPTAASRPAEAVVGCALPCVAVVEAEAAPCHVMRGEGLRSGYVSAGAGDGAAFRHGGRRRSRAGRGGAERMGLCSSSVERGRGHHVGGKIACVQGGSMASRRPLRKRPWPPPGGGGEASGFAFGGPALGNYCGSLKRVGDTCPKSEEGGHPKFRPNRSRKAQMRTKIGAAGTI